MVGEDRGHVIMGGGVTTGRCQQLAALILGAGTRLADHRLHNFVRVPYRRDGDLDFVDSVGSSAVPPTACPPEAEAQQTVAAASVEDAVGDPVRCPGVKVRQR